MNAWRPKKEQQPKLEIQVNKIRKTGWNDPKYLKRSEVVSKKNHTQERDVKKRKGLTPKKKPETHILVVIVNNVKLMSKDYANFLNSMFV